MMEKGNLPWVMIATLAVFYCFTGGAEVFPLALAFYCLLTSLTPVLAFRAARQLGVPREGALSGARLVAYSPAFAFWSGALYKEGLILIVLFLVIEHTLRLQKSIRPLSVLVLAVCLLALFGLRFYIGVIFGVCIVAGLVLGRRNRNNPEGAPAILRQALVLILVFMAFNLFGLSDSIGQLLSVKVEENLSKIDSTRRNLAMAASGYGGDAYVGDVDSAVQFLPVGLAYFLTVPLPWQLGSYRQMLAIPETLFWVLVIYPRAFRGMLRSARANPAGTVFLVLASVAICCLYALFIANIGTAYRVRVQVWAIWALFAGWGRLPAAPAAPRTGVVRRPTLAGRLAEPPRPAPVPPNGSA
jgi:hypothetical protein